MEQLNYKGHNVNFYVRHSIQISPILGTDNVSS